MPKPQPRHAVRSLVDYRPEVDALPDVPIIRLSVNEGALGPSPKALEVLAGLGGGLHRYPEQINRALTTAIAETEGLDPKRILPSNGSDELIGLLAQAYLEAGDEAIITQYGFLVFAQATRIAGATPIIAPDGGFTVSVDAILERISAKTKLIFLANPNNPTGTMISRGEVIRLIEGTPEQVIIILDSAYGEYVTADDYTCGAELVERHDNVVMLRTFSKIYGLAGLRLGWGYFPPAIFAVLAAIRGPFSVNTVSALVGAAAIKDRDFIEASIKHNRQFLPLIQDSIRQAGFEPLPSCTNFFLIRFADAGAANSAQDFLRNRGILLRNMKPYGLPQYLRMALGTEAEMATVAMAFKDLAVHLGEKA